MLFVTGFYSPLDLRRSDKTRCGQRGQCCRNFEKIKHFSVFFSFDFSPTLPANQSRRKVGKPHWGLSISLMLDGRGRAREGSVQRGIFAFARQGVNPILCSVDLEGG